MEKPKDFASWVQTHCEVSLILGGILAEEKSNALTQFYSETGRFGIHDLVREITDRFEIKNQGREWDGEWVDEIEEFVMETIDKNFETNREILQYCFKQRFGEAYVPENAEDETEHYTFEKFDEEITNCWNEDDMLMELFPMCEDLVEYTIFNIEWTFPSTFVNEISYNN